MQVVKNTARRSSQLISRQMWRETHRTGETQCFIPGVINICKKKVEALQSEYKKETQQNTLPEKPFKVLHRCLARNLSQLSFKGEAKEDLQEEYRESCLMPRGQLKLWDWTHPRGSRMRFRMAWSRRWASRRKMRGSKWLLEPGDTHCWVPDGEVQAQASPTADGQCFKYEPM